jgi:hypothetical protein
MHEGWQGLQRGNMGGKETTQPASLYLESVSKRSEKPQGCAGDICKNQLREMAGENLDTYGSSNE